MGRRRKKKSSRASATKTTPTAGKDDSGSGDGSAHPLHGTAVADERSSSPVGSTASPSGGIAAADAAAASVSPPPSPLRVSAAASSSSPSLYRPPHTPPPGIVSASSPGRGSVEEVLKAGAPRPDVVAVMLSAVNDRRRSSTGGSVGSPSSRAWRSLSMEVDEEEEAENAAALVSSDEAGDAAALHAPPPVRDSPEPVTPLVVASGLSKPATKSPRVPIVGIHTLDAEVAAIAPEPKVAVAVDADADADAPAASPTALPETPARASVDEEQIVDSRPATPVFANMASPAGGHHSFYSARLAQEQQAQQQQAQQQQQQQQQQQEELARMRQAHLEQQRQMMWGGVRPSLGPQLRAPSHPQSGGADAPRERPVGGHPLHASYSASQPAAPFVRISMTPSAEYGTHIGSFHPLHGDGGPGDVFRRQTLAPVGSFGGSSFVDGPGSFTRQSFMPGSLQQQQRQQQQQQQQHQQQHMFHYGQQRHHHHHQHQHQHQQPSFGPPPGAIEFGFAVPFADPGMPPHPHFG